jgi:hypothetical protein
MIDRSERDYTYLVLSHDGGVVKRVVRVAFDRRSLG